MTKARRPAIRTLRGWAISMLNAAGVSRECETHGWMQDRTDPYVRERAFDVARQNPLRGVSLKVTAFAIALVLNGVGDTCPDMP